MKPIFFFLILLCAGCAKWETYSYGVVCNFPTIWGGRTWLVVTDADGNVLKTFDIPEGQSGLLEKFDYRSKDPDIYYNLHLVHHDSISILDFSYPQITSIYGVKNGQAVSFLPGVQYEPNYLFEVHQLSIGELPGLYSSDVQWGYVSSDHLVYDANTHTATLGGYHLAGADGFFQIRTAPAAPVYALRVPANATDDVFYSLHWADFKPIPAYATVEWPGVGPATSLSVAAVRPDFRNYCYLSNFDGSTPDKTPPAKDQVPLPVDLYPDALFYVRVQNTNYTVEKLVSSSQALHLQAPRMTIESADFNGFKNLKVVVKGAPDLVEAIGQSKISNPGQYFQWIVRGRPESMEHLTLPDFSEILPGWPVLEGQPINWEVNAYRYDHLDYGQLLEGYPYKSRDTGIFPVARSGLERVTKSY